jgi:hypothetical protein
MGWQQTPCILPVACTKVNGPRHFFRFAQAKPGARLTL